jgi:hypothetical protein
LTQGKEEDGGVGGSGKCHGYQVRACERAPAEDVQRHERMGDMRFDEAEGQQEREGEGEQPNGPKRVHTMNRRRWPKRSAARPASVFVTSATPSSLPLSSARPQLLSRHLCPDGFALHGIYAHAKLGCVYFNQADNR